VHSDVVDDKKVPRLEEAREVTDRRVDVRRPWDEEPRAVPIRKREPGDLKVGELEVIGGEGRRKRLVLR